jgi:SAM-dependent methyltransferase
MSSEQYFNWYADSYHDGVYQHSFKHDCEVARFRLADYGIKDGSRVLDVGCGNGAFVHEAVEAGLDAWGVEPGADASQVPERTHVGELPLHDVLEHVLDPLEMLCEINRILKPDGKLFIDSPNFTYPHHWKEVEHLWMFEPSHLQWMLEESGMAFEKVYSPIESKHVAVSSPLPEDRIKILVPPGIGDVYWSLIKIKDFCQKNSFGTPDIYVASQQVGRDRCGEYIERCPFVNFAGYVHFGRHDVKWRPIWKEMYINDGETMMEDVFGYDYFIAYNGVTRHGRYIEDCDTEYDCNWQYEMHRTLPEIAAEKRYAEQFGNYTIGYFIDHGMYKEWLKEFKVKRIHQTLLKIHERTGDTIIFIGAPWDVGGLNEQIGAMEWPEGAFLDMTGKTNFDQLMGLTRACQGLVGFPSGVTIIPSMFNKPTVTIWNRYFQKNFWESCVPPAVRGTTYRCLNSTVKPATVVEEYLSATGREGKDVAE